MYKTERDWHFERINLSLTRSKKKKKKGTQNGGPPVAVMAGKQQNSTKSVFNKYLHKIKFNRSWLFSEYHGKKKKKWSFNEKKSNALRRISILIALLAHLKKNKKIEKDPIA